MSKGISFWEDMRKERGDFLENRVQSTTTMRVGGELDAEKNRMALSLCL